jgi:hypothetical protein
MALSASPTIDGDRYRSPGIRFKQRKLRPTNQLPEVTIKTDQVLTEVDRRSGKPCIQHGISFELLLDAKLPQARPLRSKRCEVDTLSGKQCIDKGQGVLDRCSGAGVQRCRRCRGLMRSSRRRPGMWR